MAGIQHYKRGRLVGAAVSAQDNLRNPVGIQVPRLHRRQRPGMPVFAKRPALPVENHYLGGVAVEIVTDHQDARIAAIAAREHSKG